MEGNSYLSFKIAFGQVIQIGDDVFVRLKKVTGNNCVQICFHAPVEKKIHRNLPKGSENPFKKVPYENPKPDSDPTPDPDGVYRFPSKARRPRR